MTLAAILDDCLQRIAAGESTTSCLAHYPDHAAALAPLLAVAAQLSGLAGQAPSAAQRQRTLVRLREAAADQRAGHRRPALAGWSASAFAARRLAMMAAAVLLLLATLSAGVVASSQPGQPGYELRVIVERAPVLVAPGPTARAAAELAVADRRLADLQTGLASTGQVEPSALRALLSGDQAAARQALVAGESERLRIIEHLTERARLLARLARTVHDPDAAQALAAAALDTQRLIEQLQTTPGGSTPQRNAVTETATPTQTATATPTVTASPTATASATNTASPTVTVTASHTPFAAAPPDWTATLTPGAAFEAPSDQSTATATPRPRPRLTAVALTETALAQTPEADQTPRPRLTAIALTATALAQTPEADQTPRPRLTAIALTATALAQTPGADQTPRPRLTAIALTATALAQTPVASLTTTPTLSDPQPTETATGEPAGTPAISPPAKPPPRPPRPVRP